MCNKSVSGFDTEVLDNSMDFSQIKEIYIHKDQSLFAKKQQEENEYRQINNSKYLSNSMLQYY